MERKTRNGKREYKTFARLQMQIDYSVDEMAEAIETVLKERQSDKAKIMHYEKLITNGLASKEITKLNEELLAEVQTNYIPKSLIKEKIEELKKELERDKICIDFAIEHEKDIELIAKKEVLEELLKGE